MRGLTHRYDLLHRFFMDVSTITPPRSICTRYFSLISTVLDDATEQITLPRLPNILHAAGYLRTRPLATGITMNRPGNPGGSFP